MAILSRSEVEDMRRAYEDCGDREVVRLCATVEELRALVHKAHRVLESKAGVTEERETRQALKEADNADKTGG